VRTKEHIAIADALTIGTAISIARNTRPVLGTASVSSSSVGSLSLDKQLNPGIFSDVRVVLGGSEAKTALSIAILSGNGIIGALKSLTSSAQLAGHDSLVNNLTNLTIDGTRISRLNLHSDTNRAISLIDGLVRKSEFGNANFISSSSPNIRINTSRFGGAINIAPQALDSIGLNLTGLSLLTDIGADDALARIESAINTATRRVESLESLQRAITNGNFSSQALSSLINSLRGDGLPLGTLVNVLG
jgi:hypothetical protein